MIEARGAAVAGISSGIWINPKPFTENASRILRDYRALLRFPFMPFALKASWEVNAGVVPGIGNAKFTKRYEYTSDDHEKDRSVMDKAEEHTIFQKIRAEAMDYYIQVSLPSVNNWATIRFTWY